MAARRVARDGGLTIRPDQPLIGIPDDLIGEGTVRYFTSEEVADEVLSEESLEEALSLAGVWSDLDLEEMLSELNRIRHESGPTPPIEFEE